MMGVLLGMNFVFLLCFCVSVLGSPCSRENRTQGTCIVEITAGLFEPNKFWFGSSEYARRCPSGEDSGVFCMNPKPDAHSISNRLFSSMDFTRGLDRYLELRFESGGKNYEACGNTFITAESWTYDVDPTSDTVVYPWYVKNFPIDVSWTSGDREYYTLMVYDAGYMMSRGLYVNILRDDMSSAQVIQQYVGPLFAADIKNPYVFLLFKQNGRISQSLSDAWKIKITTGNVAGKWTIEEFANAMNMSGLVAVNWITVTGDEWSAQTMMNKGGPYAAMCSLYTTRALLQKNRPFIANDTDLTVWIDFEFMIPEDHNMTVCCKNISYKARNFTINPLGGEVYSTWDVRTETPYRVTFTKRDYYSQSKNFTGDMYAMVQIDSDVPNPTAGTEERPILHGLVTNIVNGDLQTGDAGLPWSGPSPPDANPHYYYTLLYKQESEINATEMRYKYAGKCTGGLAGRCLYDIVQAVSENNLSLVGATWLKAKKDAYVLKRQLERTGSVEADICQGQPGYSSPCPITSTRPTARTTTEPTSTATDVLPSIITICVLNFLSFLT